MHKEYGEDGPVESIAKEKPKPIDEMLAELEQQVENLDKAFSLLHDRLAPITSEMEPGHPERTDEKMPGGSSPLLRTIRIHTDHVREIATHVHALISTLEV